MIKYIPQAIKRRIKLLLINDKEFSKYLSHKEKSRLENYPRRKSGTSILFEKPVKFTDAYWYLHSIKELFIDEVYKFKPKKQNPYIIDCGSNIGLSIIYFKQNFPNCKIKAFEADPEILKISKENVAQYGNSKDVDFIGKAVWVNDGYIEFFAEGTLGGAIDLENKRSGDRLIKIPCEDLNNHLNEQVDFLKIDIEGAELEVLKNCQGKLKNVESMFVEFHGYTSKEQNLDELLIIIKNAGFRYYIKESYPNLIFPFVEKVPNNNFDILLNVFCYRV